MKVGMKVFRKYLFPLDHAKELEEWQMFDGVFYVKDNDYIHDAESTALELAAVVVDQDIDRNSGENTVTDIGERFWTELKRKTSDPENVVERENNYIVSVSAHKSHTIFLYRIKIRYQKPKG